VTTTADTHTTTFTDAQLAAGQSVPPIQLDTLAEAARVFFEAAMRSLTPQMHADFTTYPRLALRSRSPRLPPQRAAVMPPRWRVASLPDTGQMPSLCSRNSSGRCCGRHGMIKNIMLAAWKDSDR
jgi:hypothetical protein